MAVFRALNHLTRWLGGKPGPRAKATGRRLLVNLRQASELLNVSPETIRDWIKEGRLHAAKRYVGGNSDDDRSYRWLVPETELMRLIQGWIAESMDIRTMSRRRPLPPRGPDGRWTKVRPRSNGGPPGSQGGY